MPKKKSLISFSFESLCKTSGWKNNCGLNCLSHFLVSNLVSGELENAIQLAEENAQHDPDSANFIEQYHSLLNTFQECYHLPNPPSWAEIHSYYTYNQSPIEVEASLGPVLRLHLAKILKTEAEALWNTYGTTALWELISSGKTTDVIKSVYNSNKLFFDGLKAFYHDEINKISKIDPERENKIILLQQKILEMGYHYWIEEGCNNFSDFMGNLKNKEMVSADQLQMLCEKLSIGIEIYTPKSIDRTVRAASSRGSSSLSDTSRAAALSTHGMQSAPNPNCRWAIKIFNQDKHWEYEEPRKSSPEAKKHNEFYKWYDSKSHSHKSLYDAFSDKFQAHLIFIAHSDDIPRP